MRLFAAAILAAGLGLTPLAAMAQEVAGRVLAVAGSVTIVRGAQKIVAGPGTEVRSGDLLDLGTRSNAQVRFTDDSLVALGAETSFRVTDYQYQGRQPGSQRAIFNLLKGGFRTVTGFIGRVNKPDYHFETPTATVGIRGTMFAACQECTAVNGQRLQGTIIGFTEGSGVLRTQAGEITLTAGQAAQAPSSTAPPQRTLVMPQTQQQANARPTPTQQAQAQSQSGGAAAAPASGSAAASPTLVASAAPVAVIGTPTTSTTTTTTSTTTTAPQFQLTSTLTPTDLVQSVPTGTIFYRLDGPFNIPASCGSPPCSTLVAGTFIVSVNYGLGRATANGAFRFSNGDIANVGIPIATGGTPITIDGSTVRFGGTFNLSDFPNNQGAFRCNNCGPNKTPGFLSQLTVQGTISGSSATLTFSVPDNGTNGGGSLTVTLPQSTSIPTTSVATATPISGGGIDSRATNFVTTDSSGRLTQFGPAPGGTAAGLGGPAGSVGGATNTISGSAPTAGNLVWGTWVSGSTAATSASVTDTNYNTFSATSSTIPWITGDTPTNLPQSLGTLSFTPIGAVFTTSTQLLNSASLVADFVNRSVAVSISATNTRGSTLASQQNVYSLSQTTGFSPTTGRFSTGVSSITCTGPCNSGIGTVSAGLSGFFAGPQAQGAGVVFSAGFAGASSSTGQGVTGAIGFKR